MIFISHRREETKSFVTNLYQRLLDRYGKTSVFIDFNDIQSGVPWPDAIMNALKQSRVMLAIIGPEWGKVRCSTGGNQDRLRLDIPGDWVREEICAGCRSPNMLVIPVLIDDTKLPDTDWNCELDKLRELQHARIRNMADFNQDFMDLCQRLEKHIPDLKPQPGGDLTARYAEDIYFLFSVPQEEEPDSFNRILEDQMRNHDHFAEATFLPLSRISYMDDYSSGFDHFVNVAKEGAWLLTIRPEEGTWPYESPDSKEKLVRNLARQHKHVIFFESDDDLRTLSTKLDLNPNPIIVINTDPNTAVGGLIRYIDAEVLSGSLVERLVIITMPGPNAFVAHARRKEFNEFISALHRNHNLPQSLCGQFQSEGVKNICERLRKTRVSTETTVLKKWFRECAKAEVNGLLEMHSFLKDSPDKVVFLFLCGSDQLALGAWEAVKEADPGEKGGIASRSWFFGIDGLKEMKEALTDHKIRGYTMVPGYRLMCEKAIRAMRNPAAYQTDNNPTPLWGWDSKQGLT